MFYWDEFDQCDDQSLKLVLVKLFHEFEQKELVSRPLSTER